MYVQKTNTSFRYVASAGRLARMMIQVSGAAVPISHASHQLTESVRSQSISMMITIIKP
jgi:hypothetical protein